MLKKVVLFSPGLIVVVVLAGPLAKEVSNARMPARRTQD